MTAITAASVSGSRENTVVTDTQGVAHPVPAEGLPVVVTAPLTLANGQTIEPGSAATTVFRQPPVGSSTTTALAPPIDNIDQVPGYVATMIAGALGRSIGTIDTSVTIDGQTYPDSDIVRLDGP